MGDKELSVVFVGEVSCADEELVELSWSVRVELRTDRMSTDIAIAMMVSRLRTTNASVPSSTQVLPTACSIRRIWELAVAHQYMESHLKYKLRNTQWVRRLYECMHDGGSCGNS